MQRVIFGLGLMGLMTVSSHHTYAESERSLPCSMILPSVDQRSKNANGAALIYKVKLTPSFPRTSISIHALHLPAPSTLGNYDTYEGFAFIPGEISWRFKLQPIQEKHGSIWAGKIEDITAQMTGVQIQVRPSNSKTRQLGAPVLTNHVKYCK
ncbi:hypothetical protein PNH38_07390 [Anoxybacillus rupiensis]|uniref:Uncharacterized protein n=1 Tax=Anoxybacteroides rupiense TaxID=311460 RepID=A0ABT5W304_9BACL|nr:hypothetical protein [Anoxybacillus rupiensis]MBS2772922.1 hypothetical protein [Anoxybacillus rupiensis]MDE8563708.1 hypothetical protein [Anoxybacillus rupiensis]